MNRFLERILGFGAVLSLGLALNSYGARRKATPPEIVSTRATFLECHDGDTCTVKSPDGLRLKLRLLGIDAPEVGKPGRKSGRRLTRGKPGQAYGPEARAALVSRVVGKTLPIEIHGSDPYNRYLALIWTDPAKKGPSLNETLIREGNGYAYSGENVETAIRAWAVAAQDEARKAKRGLWKLAEPPEDPSLFRRKSGNGR